MSINDSRIISATFLRIQTCTRKFGFIRWIQMKHQATRSVGVLLCRIRLSEWRLASAHCLPMNDALHYGYTTCTVEAEGATRWQKKKKNWRAENSNVYVYSFASRFVLSMISLMTFPVGPFRDLGEDDASAGRRQPASCQRWLRLQNPRQQLAPRRRRVIGLTPWPSYLLAAFRIR